MKTFTTITNKTYYVFPSFSKGIYLFDNCKFIDCDFSHKDITNCSFLSNCQFVSCKFHYTKINIKDLDYSTPLFTRCDFSKTYGIKKWIQDQLNLLIVN
jgi:uncharacterized protein YjbI with pentapeptide repeats